MKKKADLNDIALAEADIINLKKKVEDLEVQLNQQLEKKSTSMNDSCSQRQPNHHAKKEDKPKGTGAVVKESGSKVALPITSEPAVVHLCLKWLLLLRKLLERLMLVVNSHSTSICQFPFNILSRPRSHLC
ncbi:uncharacterized protein [Gossypium hirsutum]|uniref:Uncharacterized protein isoform X2 n=1 Tax=Gossypium hirsutum TaxID=3635 RepID=A0ABM3C327_GOSHI|nr:uncharacterized protein LOC107953135 isoform X2 [Gossypium hirsutum]